jgi:hypothetical protein
MNTETIIEVKEIAPPARRQFPDVLNEWTDTLLELNRTATPEQALLIMRLGPLGQRLIFEANALGVNEVLRQVRKVQA